MPVKRGWIPPRSPYSLIQEDLWGCSEFEWMILVSCMMLNQTSRKQVERVLPEFQRRWPTPQRFISANRAEIYEVCRSLGFANRRTDNMVKMTHEYLGRKWTHARELYGIGEYGARCWEIFCQGNIGDEPPNDHALVQYFTWAKSHKLFE